MSYTSNREDAPDVATQAPEGMPWQVRLVMVAVDGSEQSMWAVQVAAALAPLPGAHVVLVHVMDLNAVGASEIALSERETRAEILRRADELFASAQSQLPRGVPIRRLLREGDPGQEIVASAAEWEADLVVIGTHGRGRLATFLLGSTAGAVIRGAHCPVLAVAHEPRGNAPSSGAGSIGSASIAL